MNLMTTGCHSSSIKFFTQYTHTHARTHTHRVEDTIEEMKFVLYKKVSFIKGGFKCCNNAIWDLD